MPNLNNGVLEGLRRIGASFRSVSLGGGVPGAPLGLRLLGATSSGAPATGTWKAGDHVEDRTGAIWICTAGGSPGTWVLSGAQAGFAPSDFSYATWTYEPSIAVNTSVLPTGGQVVLARVNLRQAALVTNVVFYMSTLGSTLTSGQNFAGLYSSSGALIGTSADQTTTWNTGGTTGLQTVPLTGGPFAVPAGFAWIAWLFNGTTGPTFSRAANLGSVAGANLSLTAATARYAHTAPTSQTSLASFTPSASTLTATEWWAALS